jgi:hypothetical protein
MFHLFRNLYFDSARSDLMNEYIMGCEKAEIKREKEGVEIVR